MGSFESYTNKRKLMIDNIIFTKEQRTTPLTIQAILLEIMNKVEIKLLEDDIFLNYKQQNFIKDSNILIDILLKNNIVEYEYINYNINEDGFIIKLNFTNQLMIECLPIDIGNLSMLNSIIITNNKLHTIPCEITNLSSLYELYLNDNLLFEIPSQIKYLTALTILDISNNHLELLPIEIGNLASLKYLYLSNNVLSSIPFEIEKLTLLQVLDVCNNKLIKFPNVTKLLNLTSLELSYNFIGEQIPRSIGNLVNLTSIEISHNQLIGSIPSNICNLYKLSWLDLSFNRLVGVLASDFRKLTMLHTLYLNNNKIKVPLFIYELPILDYYNF